IETLGKGKQGLSIKEVTSNGNIIKSIEDKIQKHFNSHPYIDKQAMMIVEDALEFSDLSDLEKIICEKSNYDSFATFFGSKEEFIKRFNQVGAFRIQKRHSRRMQGQGNNRRIDSMTINDCKAGMEWFERIQSRGSTLQ
ncbi:MAG: hypothetical protein RIE59_01385, partial [Imperialibacter sp.]